MGHVLSRWYAGKIDLSPEPLRWIVAGILASVRERDDRWHALASNVFDLPESALRDHVTHDDSVLLFILIHITRHAIHSNSWSPWILSSHPRFNIRDTLPRLQNDFCALWNESVTLVGENGDDRPLLVDILRRIRHSYIALHQSSDAAPTAFSHSNDDNSSILFEPSSYPMCTVASHRSESAARDPTATSPTVSPPTLGHSPNVSPRYALVECHTLPLISPDITDYNTIQGNADNSAISGPARAGPAQQQIEEAAKIASFVYLMPHRSLCRRLPSATAPLLQLPLHTRL